MIPISIYISRGLQLATLKSTEPSPKSAYILPIKSTPTYERPFSTTPLIQTNKMIIVTFSFNRLLYRPPSSTCLPLFSLFSKTTIYTLPFRTTFNNIPSTIRFTTISRPKRSLSFVYPRMSSPTFAIPQTYVGDSEFFAFLAFVSNNERPFVSLKSEPETINTIDPNIFLLRRMIDTQSCPISYEYTFSIKTIF